MSRVSSGGPVDTNPRKLLTLSVIFLAAFGLFSERWARCVDVSRHVGQHMRIQSRLVVHAGSTLKRLADHLSIV